MGATALSLCWDLHFHLPDDFVVPRPNPNTVG